jgi:hypothetical protein
MTHHSVMTVVNAFKILNYVEENFQTGFKYVLPYSSVFGGTQLFLKSWASPILFFKYVTSSIKSGSQHSSNLLDKVSKSFPSTSYIIVNWLSCVHSQLGEPRNRNLG